MDKMFGEFSGVVSCDLKLKFSKDFIYIESGTETCRDEFGMVTQVVNHGINFKYQI